MSDGALPTTIEKVSFSFLASDEIRRISVKQVVNATLFDATQLPTKGGLYDPALGPVKRGDNCTTCRLTSYECPGHFGHIELPVPVFHTIFIAQMFALLRGSCKYCHHFLLHRQTIIRYIAKLILLERGLVNEAESVDELSTKMNGSAKKAAKGKAKDEGEGGELEQAEADDVVKRRLTDWIRVSTSRAGSTSTRDDYKPGMCFEKRRKLIQEFLKEIAKRKCARCGANAHRMRKEGHTKMMEFSLTSKQALQHEGRVADRKNIIELDTAYRTRVALAKEKAQTRREANGDYDERQYDSDEGDEPGRGRVASPASGSDADMTSDSDDEPSRDPNTLRDAVSLESRQPKQPPKKQTERIMPAEECRAHLRLLFLNEPEMCNLLYSAHGLPAEVDITSRADMFFVECLSIPPTRFRPASTMGGLTFENEQNSLFSAILSTTYSIRDINTSLRLARSKDATAEGVGDPVKLYTQLLEATFRLQANVNSLFDSTKNPSNVRGNVPTGIKQMLEKKEGLFRMNMMGKRVNYSARSVISPDVNIETNEIGVPPVFAKKLTFPEPVTQHNVAHLAKLVHNGPRIHPGAVYIEYEGGRIVSLERMTEEERKAQANQLLTPDTKTQRAGVRIDIGLPNTKTQGIPRKVYRHLDDGDILILNRQPTLHKPSMMCHRAKILSGEKTIRMHYANCNSYNADFDGDEMNMHFPQSLIAQAEAKLIANTDNQYLVPTSGNPLRGLIQDHVVAGVHMTNKDTFFTRSEYHQLIYGALRTEDDYTGEGLIRTVPPAMIRPKVLWTGKQIITTVLLNIKPHNTSGLHVKSKSKVPSRAWRGAADEEDTVQFYDGEYISGILDKSQFGASAYGLVHAVYEVYGQACAGKLLSIFSRLFTKYLQHRAFTCRMDDLLLTKEGNSWRDEILSKAAKKGYKAAMGYVDLEVDEEDPKRHAGLHERLEEVLRDDAKMALLDVAVKSEANGLTSAVIARCIPDGLHIPFPLNHMQTMTVSGAKGSGVNVSQISCLLGQQELEGRRVPTMVSGKTLPSFRPFETAPRAGGYVAQRFLTGIRPQEYYFHCMAGREGLIDTAVKTSRSGYLQRCLIKHLEGIRVHYDHTVRNSDGTVIQFLYGEDAVDVTKSRYLYEFDFAINNRQSLVQRHRPMEIAGRLDERTAPAHSKAILKALRARRKDGKDEGKLPAPTQSLYHPSTFVGSVSEMYAEAIDSYTRDNAAFLLDVKEKRKSKWHGWVRKDQLYDPIDFRNLMYFRYMKSLADPGEAVGLLASQGVGEPSTQMTLNTFHFAGHGAANVTLGIPRLREIVMTASANIKTPTMKIPFLDSMTAEAQASFVKLHSRLTLSEIVDEIRITELLSTKSEETDFARRKLYKIRLIFYPRFQYCEEYATTPEEVLLGISRNFVSLLNKEIAKEFKMLAKQDKSSVGDVGKGKASAREGPTATTGAGEEDPETGAETRGVRADAMDVDVGDGDADDAKRAARSKQNVSYDDSDDEIVAETAVPNELDDAAFDAEFDDDEDDKGDDEELIDPGETDAQREKRENRLQYMKDLESIATVQSKYIDKLEFDKEKGEWAELSLEFAAAATKLLLVGIVERACRMAVVRQVPGITRCLITPPQGRDTVTYCTTEGANFTGAWRFGYGSLDLNQIYSNDIAAILRTYGVEAARSTIIKEMSGVFGAYGIGVDKRHLTLIADYMTGEGGYRPFNRTGISSSSSPFLKASFETTSQFIADAALYGDFDDTQSPSASIVLGKIAHTGTGSFQVRLPLPPAPVPSS